MPHLQTWDEFANVATDLYANDPVNSRFTIKYRHLDGKLNVKFTDNKKVYQYLATQKEVKNVDTFMCQLMKNMVTRGAS